MNSRRVCLGRAIGEQGQVLVSLCSRDVDADAAEQFFRRLLEGIDEFRGR